MFPSSRAVRPSSIEAERFEAYPFPSFWNRKVWVTPLDTILLNFKGYKKRVGRALVYILSFALSCALIAGVAALILTSLTRTKEDGSSILTTLTTAMGITYPVYSDDDGLHASTGGNAESMSLVSKSHLSQANDAPFSSSVFWICLVEVGLVGIVSMIFSGAIPELFLTPVDCMKVARYAIIQKRKDGRWVLSTRFWICLPQTDFLHDVSVSVNYNYTGRYSESSLDASSSETAVNHICDAHYSMLRGVWSIDIALDSEEGRKLYRLFTQGDKRPRAQYIFQGQTSSGEIISKVAAFDLSHILFGYSFAPYQRDSFCDARGLDHDKIADYRQKFYDYSAFGKLEVNKDYQEYASDEDPVLAPWIELLSEQNNTAVDEFVQEARYTWQPKLSYQDLSFLNSL